jgi:hypothetical protein
VALATRSRRVLYVSNVEGALDSGYAGAAAAAQRLFGALPVVAYDRGPGLDAAKGAGFRPIGALRVWAKP